jgi:hypothetical protein
MIAHGASIMEIEIERLRTANALLSKRKQRKKKAYRGINTMSIADGLKRNVQSSITESTPSNGSSTAKQRRCGRCREPGHRIETCKMPQVDVQNNE